MILSMKEHEVNRTKIEQHMNDPACPDRVAFDRSSIEEKPRGALDQQDVDDRFQWIAIVISAEMDQAENNS
ncbi:hypothetical protein NRIC_07400 [Enterococcus florum]|uniref:Uncharacterized protein n=1 Tax=Enterococcus florum TaxID=2480627 RepID=A0A4V0WP72_9ENTE|nr:hypothetical protein NRIC_07400 [Enterococcus florum]